MTFSTFEIYYLRTTLCGDSLHLHGSRKIGGVYGRYLGSRGDICRDYILLKSPKKGLETIADALISPYLYFFN